MTYNYKKFTGRLNNEVYKKFWPDFSLFMISISAYAAESEKSKSHMNMGE